MPARLPAKFAVLARLRDCASVPPTVCLQRGDLAGLFRNIEEVSREALRIVDEIARTSGSFLHQHFDAIERTVAGLAWQPDAAARLDAIFAPVFADGWRARPFAVRSAADMEDSAAHSFAGVFLSLLGVRGEEALKKAIAAVWASGFSRRSLIEQISLGMTLATNPVAVLVQQMVHPRLAGVAFSRHPVNGSDEAVIEFVEGIGDVVASGEASARRVAVAADGTVQSCERLPAAQHESMRRVAALVAKVKSQLGHDVDIEWAIDATDVWLLQARPLTVVAGERSAARSLAPVFLLADLYGAEGPIDALRPLPEFADYFRSKRKHINDFAARHGFGRGAAVAVRANRVALEDAGAADKLQSAFGHAEVVVDFSGRVRQLIVATESLVGEVKALMPDPHCIHCFVVRDFIRGEAGLISQVAEKTARTAPAVIVEWSPDGLMALNRGTAAARQLALGPRVRDADGLPLGRTQTARLRRGTLAAQEEIGPIQIEWVISRGELYPLDFSLVANGSGLSASGANAIVAKGFAAGPVVTLADHDELRIMSIAPAMSVSEIPDAYDLGPMFAKLMRRIDQAGARPIIVAPRPLAILASLIPHVGGFVFERAPLLCHLAILLREHGVPAVQSPELFSAAAAAEHITLEAYEDAVVSPASALVRERT